MRSRNFAWSLQSSTLCFAARLCSTTSTPPNIEQTLNIAPKKAKRTVSTNKPIDASQFVKSLNLDPEAKAELSTAELERKVEEWSKMSPAELEALYKQFEAEEEAGSKVLEQDSLYQMDVSMKTRAAGAVKVFWKEVSVVPLDAARYPGWFAVAVDGRKVKAFESNQVLAIPSEAMAYACANEYASQKGHLNKLLMPLTDLCSGAMQVQPQAIAPRVDYLMSFYQNDNCYFRAKAIEGEQDRLIEPVAKWFERVFEVDVPRIVGIGHPQIPPHNVAKVRDALLASNMNPYQIVALCVVAQFTSSLLLPLALFHRVIDLEQALAINRAEEGHNIATAGMIEGYHDIREADSVVKICASATAWQLMQEVQASRCDEIPRSFVMEEIETPY